VRAVTVREGKSVGGGEGVEGGIDLGGEGRG